MSVVHLSEENFEAEVINSDKPVLVDFWAAWCGPCQMLGPVIEELAGEVSDVKICKLDVDANNELAVKYGVMSIPTLILFKNGEVEDKSIGLVSKKEIMELIGK